MTCADLVVAGLDQLLTCGGPAPRTGPAMKEVGLLEKAWIAGYQGKIIFIGPEQEFRQRVEPAKGARIIDGAGLVGLPGLVDCHTHLPFAGNREKNSPSASRATPTSSWPPWAWVSRPQSRPPGKPAGRISRSSAGNAADHVAQRERPRWRPRAVTA